MHACAELAAAADRAQAAGTWRGAESAARRAGRCRRIGPSPRSASPPGWLLLYVLRVWIINGWYIVTYGLGIYILNLLIGFLSPQSDPEIEGPTLPTSKDDEFRPSSAGCPSSNSGSSSAASASPPRLLPI